MLTVENLSTYCYNRQSSLFGRLIEGIDFRVKRGEVLAITGESGCGKTVTVSSVMGLIDFLPGIIRGRIGLMTGRRGETIDLLEGLEEVWELERKGVIVEKKKKAYQNWKRERSGFLKKNIYGKEISFIFQDPRAHLNPYMSIGKQLEEVFALHRPDVAGADYRNEVAQWLKNRVNLLDKINKPSLSYIKKAYKTYQSDLSGGMCQKALIAMALASHPSLLIADEPTTGLDRQSEGEIIRLLRNSRKICGNQDLSILLVTHELKLIKELADRVIVMYAGQVVEEGPVKEVFSPEAVNHPYTARLRECMEADCPPGTPLPTIPGEAHDPFARFDTCRFGARKCCPDLDDDCKIFGNPQEYIRLSETHKIKCRLS